MSIEEWITKTEEEKNKIRRWNPVDRLEIVSKLAFMNGSIASSVTGWHSWLSNSTVMEKFTLEELAELADEFQRIAILFLELDLKYTRMMLNKKTKERNSNEIQSQNNYVS